MTVITGVCVCVSGEISLRFSFSSSEPLISLRLFSVEVFRPSSILKLFSMLCKRFSCQSNRSYFSIGLNASKIVITTSIVPNEIAAITPPCDGLNLRVFFEMYKAIRLAIAIKRQTSDGRVFTRMKQGTSSTIDSNDGIKIRLYRIRLIVKTALSIAEINTKSPVALVPRVSPKIILFCTGRYCESSFKI